MKVKLRFFIALLFFSQLVWSQTSLKFNVATALIGIPNIGFETNISEHFTFQVDATASFWKSVNGGPQEFLMLFPEVRYYTSGAKKGFFVGGHIGGSAYKIQKWNYLNSDYYQKGYSVMYGATIGYQFKIGEKFNLEFFLGGGSQQGYYNGYLVSTDERYENARNFNKSGELLPYRGGLMLVYKL